MNDPLQPVADSAIASELALGLLLETLADHHPEVIQDFRTRLSYLLQRNDIPTDGAKANLTAILSALP